MKNATIKRLSEYQAIGFKLRSRKIFENFRFFLSNFLVMNFSYLNLRNSLFWVRQSKSLNCFAFWLSAQLFSLFNKMDPRWPLFRMTFFVTSDHWNVIGNFHNGPVHGSIFGLHNDVKTLTIKHEATLYFNFKNSRMSNTPRMPDFKTASQNDPGPFRDSTS